MAVLVRR